MSVTSGPGRDPPHWHEIEVPSIFVNPAAKAYIEGFRKGWQAGVVRYLDEVPTEGYFVLVKGLVKAWSESYGTKWTPKQRKWALEFLEKPESREQLKRDLKHVIQDFLEAAVRSIESAPGFPRKGGGEDEGPSA